MEDILQKLLKENKFLFIVAKSMLLTLVALTLLNDFFKMILQNMTLLLLAIVTFYIFFVLYVELENEK
ncbi:hypothetical protein J4207_04095 [Candidatus Woesearchaeota archaeon]|nr:hypothetical protein [Candidatus Woesearchaeota archaeon]